MKQCAGEKCRAAAAPRRRYCYACKYQREKARDGQRTAYHRLKSNAKRRRIPFDLSLDEFRSFCIETEILLGRGRTATSWQIDRINDDPFAGYYGYRADNIRKCTTTENVQKELEKRRRSLQYDYQTRFAWWHQHPTGPPAPDASVPF